MGDVPHYRLSRQPKINWHKQEEEGDPGGGQELARYPIAEGMICRVNHGWP